METDWKHLATTKGYKSLKAAYIRDVTEAAKRGQSIRNKSEYLHKFKWVIGRALHYASHTKKSVEEILNEWEEKRSYWWLSYYQDGNQPIFHMNGIKPAGVKGTRKYYERMFGKDPKRMAERMKSFTNKKSKKTKPRWPMARKKRGY